MARVRSEEEKAREVAWGSSLPSRERQEAEALEAGAVLGAGVM